MDYPHTRWPACAFKQWNVVFRAVTYDDADDLDMVLVCGGTNVANFVNDKVVNLLRRIARDGVVLGGLCTGTYALVKSGLLDGYRCTIHWENMAGLREFHSRVKFQEELFVVDRDRMTCTGGIAPIDMMLALVRSSFGKTLVAEISNQFILERVRDGYDRQHIPLAARLGFNHGALVDIAALMEANFEEPLSAVELAKLAGLSLRQVQRMFQETLDTTPTKYYLQLRLRRAREFFFSRRCPLRRYPFPAASNRPAISASPIAPFMDARREANVSRRSPSRRSSTPRLRCDAKRAARDCHRSEFAVLGRPDFQTRQCRNYFQSERSMFVRRVNARSRRNCEIDG